MRVSILRCLTAMCAVALAAPASAQFLLDLQNLPTSDQFTSEAFAISGDGLVIGGTGTPSQTAWILDSKLDPTFLAPGYSSNAVRGLSWNGEVAVGSSTFGAFRWSASTGVSLLGTLGGNESFALGVSADGTVVTGAADSPGGTQLFLEAFRWTLTNPATGEGQMVGLGDLPGGDQYSVGTGISADGSVIVGGASSAASLAGGFSCGYDPFRCDYEAFRWTQAGGMQALGDLAGGSYQSLAWGVSADGRVVVGESSSAQAGLLDVEAFRWTAATGMVGLGDLPGGNFISMAYAANADGSLVVGASAVAIGDGGNDVFAPFIWDERNGMRDLRDVFAQLGLSMPELVMTHAYDISDDGLVVTGAGTSIYRTPALDLRTEAWVGGLALPEPGASSATLAAWVCVLGLARLRRGAASKQRPQREPARRAAPEALL